MGIGIDHDFEFSANLLGCRARLLLENSNMTTRLLRVAFRRAVLVCYRSDEVSHPTITLGELHTLNLFTSR